MELPLVQLGVRCGSPVRDEWGRSWGKSSWAAHGPHSPEGDGKGPTEAAKE